MSELRTNRHRTTRFMACGVVAALSLYLLAFASPALAVDEHVYDPALSLTGTATDPGSSHPPKPIQSPCGVATDRLGYIYVATPFSGAAGAQLMEGRIDVFNPQGEFVTQILDENQPCDLAVDSEGNIFVVDYSCPRFENEYGAQSDCQVLQFEPEHYPPAANDGYTSTVFAAQWVGGVNTNKRPLAIAIDPSNDHVYINYGGAGGHGIAEYDSVANGATLIQDAIGNGLAGSMTGIDVYGTNHDVYAAGLDKEKPVNTPNDAEYARLFIFDGADGHLKHEVDGSDTPHGGFGFKLGRGGVAVDQANGDAYVSDLEGNGGIVQFSADGQYIGILPNPPSLKPANDTYGYPGIAVDGPYPGQADYESPNEGYVFVTQGAYTNAHLYAFAPKLGEPPLVRAQTVTDVTQTEAVLGAELNPGNLDTSYRFEYVTQAEFEQSEYGDATSVPVPDATQKASKGFVAVQRTITGLEPGTAYRFRLVASNEEGEVEGAAGEDTRFATYAPEPAGLPDGRAYELVTPPDTGGYVPTVSEFAQTYDVNLQINFPTSFSSPDGESVVFGIEGGSLPGFPGGGYHDTYRAARGSDGWRTEFNGVTGTQSYLATPGGLSPDHESALWAIQKTINGDQSGTLDVEGTYIRRPGGVLDSACSPEPQGKFELLGCGSLGVDPFAEGKLITTGAAHTIFATRKAPGAQPVRLEPAAAPTGTTAVYDRDADGVTRVISVKPGGDAFEEAENAAYRGASVDGTAVAFEVIKGTTGNGTTYVRVENEETREVGTGVAFAGLSWDGERLFYLQPKAGQPQLPGTKIPQGEIFAFDTASGSAAPIGSGEEAVLVNVSADGSTAYFASPEQLDGSEGELGESNLYAWDGDVVRFVATLAPGDLAGTGGRQWGGLGLWATDAIDASPGADPSRVTADGGVLVFESHADLTDQVSGGRSQVYRYDAGADRLSCLSCNPTGVVPTSDAELQVEPPPAFTNLPPVSAFSRIQSLTDDGRRVFFQSAERLSMTDVDGKLDVYEWQAPSVDGCSKQSGCLRLVSSGQSAAEDYLFAMTPDGSDVFFLSGDLLVAEDRDASLSIYDARVGGGFPPRPSPAAECLGEACQPAVQAPEPAPIATAAPPRPGNRVASTSRRRCPKGKRKVHRAGKRVRCVKRKAKRHKRKRASARKGRARR